MNYILGVIGSIPEIPPGQSLAYSPLNQVTKLARAEIGYGITLSISGSFLRQHDNLWQGEFIIFSLHRVPFKCIRLKTNLVLLLLPIAYLETLVTLSIKYIPFE